MFYTYKKNFIAPKQTKKVVTDQIPNNSDPYNGAHKVRQGSLPLQSTLTAAETETCSAGQKLVVLCVLL